MDSHSVATKTTAIGCTGDALRAIEHAEEHLDVAVEQLSKVPAMAPERQKLSRLRRQLGRALYLIDDRRTELRRRGALVLETPDMGASKAAAGVAECVELAERR